ncbi:MAG: hypothetical protein QXJ75_02035 [Candidatus Bathyarchaeia archaeon]
MTSKIVTIDADSGSSSDMSTKNLLASMRSRERRVELANTRLTRNITVPLWVMLLVGSSLVYVMPAIANSQPQVEAILEGLSHPTGVAVDSEGNVYFAEFALEGALKRYSVDGSVTVLLSPLTSAAGVAVGVEGEVYVVESAEGVLWRAVSGLRGAEVVLEEPGIWDLAVDSEGTLYVSVRSVNGSLIKLPHGADRPEVLLSGLNVPYGIAVDSRGNVYFVEFGSAGAEDGALKMLPKGQLEPVTLAGGLRNPYDVAVDDAGRVYFTEKGGTLKVLEPGSDTPKLLLSELGRVYGIAFDRRGGLILSSFGSPVGEGGDGALLRLQVPEASWPVEVWLLAVFGLVAFASSLFFFLRRRGHGRSSG